MLHTKRTIARTTTREKGDFSAIAAAYTLDRQNDRIAPGAFAKTIAAWQDRGTPLPLHWNHSAKAEDVIGTVDPQATKETDAGLYIEGNLDLENSQVARDTWRSMKRGSIGLSFGYMVNRSHDEDGVKILDEVDLFEVTLTPAPANPDNRVLSMKSAPQIQVATFEA